MRLRDWHKREIQKNPEYAAASAEIEFAQSIADKLVDARIRAGLTQGDLAARAGTTQARISEMETGDGNPTVETVAKVFAALGLTLGVTPRPIKVERATATLPTTSTEFIVDLGVALTTLTGIEVRGRARADTSSFDEASYTGIHLLSQRVERVA